MFCDLVGSTALSEKLDPEKYSKLIAEYQQLCKESINLHDGEIHDFLGDGVITFFGFPMAHEDDAKRSILCALDILNRIKETNQYKKEKGLESISARVGIHSGIVVAGEIVGRKQVLGKTSNIAARLEGLADDNTVVISPATYKLVKGYFEVESLGRFPLKGISSNMEVFNVVGRSGKSNRLDFISQEELSPFVGRDREMNFILDQWKEIDAQRGNAILIKGDAGIGKSRLIKQIKEDITQKFDINVMEIQSSSMLTNSSLYPLVGLLKNHLFDEIGEKEKGFNLEDVRAAFQEYDFDAEHLVVLADLVAVQLDADFERPYLSAIRQKQIAFEIITRYVLGYAKNKSLLIIFEDLHWADHSTLEWIAAFSDQIPTNSIFALVTTRPLNEYPDWVTKSEIFHLTLSPLGEKEVQTICDYICKGIQLPQELLAGLVSKSDGIPLYVEEFTSDILESGRLFEEDGQYILADKATKLTIPTTLQDSLTSRLDRHPQEKALAQLGAVLGRDFSYEIIREVSGTTDDLLKKSLNRLKESEILYVQGAGKEQRYIFKHALLQDAAYNSLLSEDRKSWHHKVAEILDSKYPDLSNNQPELVAHHLMGAELYAQAIPKWMQAGNLARQQSANVEAIKYFEEALQLIEKQTESSIWVESEIQILLALIGLYSSVRSMADDSLQELQNRAYNLSQKAGLSSNLIFVNCGIIAHAGLSGNFDKALKTSDILLKTAEETGDETHSFVAYLFSGMISLWTGSLKRGRESQERARDLYDPEKHGFLKLLGMGDLNVLNLTWYEWELTCQGYLDQVIEVNDLVFSLIQSHNHVQTSISTYANTSLISCIRREKEKSLEIGKAAYDLATEKHELFYISIFEQSYGFARLINGDNGGQEMIERGIANQIKVGNRFSTTISSGLYAEYLIDENNLEKGEYYLDLAMKLVQEHKNHFAFAEEYIRIKGKLHLRKGALEAAEEQFEIAISLARSKQSKLFELRACKNLAELWISQGKVTQAGDLLSNIYSWFTEGSSTSIDLREAKDILENIKKIES